MKTKKRRAQLPARLEKARHRFERWRKVRQRRTIPEEFWASAVKLATAYGIHLTARALRLNNQSLKNRVESVDPGGSPGAEVVPAFWELMPSRPDCVPECRVELEDAHGAKMRVEWKGGEFPDFAVLSRSFWNGMP